MILDTIENAGRYGSIHPLFTQALRWLVERDLSGLPDGRYEIEGDRCFVIMARARGRHVDEVRLEAHRKFIDIQYCIDGHDTIGWRPASECRPYSGGYSDEKDIVFFRDRPAAWVTLRPGMFAVFFPEDAHAPLVSDGIVHKVVVKIAVRPS